MKSFVCLGLFGRVHWDSRVRIINSDEHDAKQGVRSEQEQPLAPEHRDKPGASSSQQGNRGKNKGESVSGAELRRAKRAGMQQRRTVSTDLHINKTASVQKGLM
jgi:hypothetical protein